MILERSKRVPMHDTKIGASAQLIAQLSAIARSNGLADLAQRLVKLRTWVGAELREIDAQLASLPIGDSRIERAAKHLLDIGGKHLRPLCLAVACKAGKDFDSRARDLAMAVELVHSATLLHDDVIDMGEARRGHSTPRIIYGNAASIYAGDWLLVQALMRIQRADVPGLMDKMLQIIADMVEAESLQLDNRGRINASFDDYFQVVEGKTAALFRWALYAGGKVGDLSEKSCDALEAYGRHLGIAFQAVDDLLDVDGDAEKTGKMLFTDLREGKMTYPLLTALERKPDLREPVEECRLGQGDAPLPPLALAAVLQGIEETGAVGACREFAREHSAKAVAALTEIGNPQAAEALTTIAQATTFRKH